MARRSYLLPMIVLLASLFSISLAPAQQADSDEKPVVEKKLFSGPQVGEKLPPLTAQAVFGDEQGKKLNLVKSAGKKPVLVVFVHQLTRPSAALTRVLMNFTIPRDDDVYGATVFLTADGTATRDIVSSQEGDVDWHAADAGKKRAVLPTEIEAGLFKQVARPFGQPSLAGDTNA